MWPLILMAICWLISALPAQAQVTFFSETFDGYGTEAQTLTALRAKYVCSYSNSVAWGNGAAQDLDAAQRFGGTYSVKQAYTGSQYDNPPQGGGACEFDFYGNDSLRKDVWITWYHYLGSNWQSSGGGGVGGVATKGIYMYMKSLSTGQVNGWVFHYFYGGNQLTMSAQGIKDHKGPNGPGTGTAIPYDTENMWQNVAAYDQPRSRWVCYEANYKLNDPGQANGRYVLYSTDMTAGGAAVLRASHTNREFLDSTPSGQMPSDARWFRFKFYRQDGWGDMWYDNVSVTSYRLGCSGTPPPPSGDSGGSLPPPDTTLPNAPTNLTVTELWHDFKQFVATVWQWIGPASAEAAVPNDKLTLYWISSEPGVDYELRWQYFGHPDWINLGLVPSKNLQLVVPLSPPITCQAGQDCYVCADARAKRLSDGVFSQWVSETPNGKACNQFAVGPIAIPPPPPIPTVDTFKNLIETELKLSFQYLPADCPKGITKATSTTSKTTGLRTVTLTCAK